MTKSVTCDRCGRAVETDVWNHHVHATVEFGWAESTVTGTYERGPANLHLCDKCSDWLGSELGIELPADQSVEAEDSRAADR